MSDESVLLWYLTWGPTRVEAGATVPAAGSITRLTRSPPRLKFLGGPFGHRFLRILQANIVVPSAGNSGVVVPAGPGHRRLSTSPTSTLFTLRGSP